MAEPGPLLGSGRAADVYDIGGGRVLRRYKPGQAHGSTEQEALVMRHVRAHGYPVPDVFDVDGPDLVMERLAGVTMLTDIEKHPWRLDRHADTWAELVGRLATVPVGELGGAGLAVRLGPPDVILHLDFHPENIMLTPDGPFVFDWSNAALGPRGGDAAQAWLIAASSTVDGARWMQVLVRLLRRRLVDRFVDACGRADALALLPAAADHRLQDRNVRPEEAQRIRDLVASLTGPEC